MSPKAIFAAMASLLALAACATGRGAGSRSAAVTPDDPPVRVNVTNNYAMPAEIYAIACGTQHRLGLAYPGLVSHYVLPQAFLECGSTVEFVAQPTGTNDHPVRAGEEMLQPGDVVDFQITMHLIASYTAVRSGS